MEFEVSFRETLRQLTAAKVHLNSFGDDLDRATLTALRMSTATSKAVGEVKRSFEAMRRYADRNRLLTEKQKKQIEQAEKAALKFFDTMATGNARATIRLQALNGQLGDLDRLVKDTAAKQAYTRWLEKSAALSADAAGRTDFYRNKLAHLATEEGRAAVESQRLAQERTKNIQLMGRQAAMADSHVRTYQRAAEAQRRLAEAQRVAAQTASNYSGIINQVINSEREMAVTGQRLAWGYEVLTARQAEFTSQQQRAKAAVDVANTAMVQGVTNLERYTGANAQAALAARRLADEETRANAQRQSELANLRRAMEGRAAQDRQYIETARAASQATRKLGEAEAINRVERERQLRGSAAYNQAMRAQAQSLLAAADASGVYSAQLSRLSQLSVSASTNRLNQSLTAVAAQGREATSSLRALTAQEAELQVREARLAQAVELRNRLLLEQTRATTTSSAATARYGAEIDRLSSRLRLQEQLRQAEAAATIRLTDAERRQTHAMREQIREYERKTRLANLTTAQLLGMQSTTNRLSRDMHLNAQAAAMFRAALGGLNASIGIYTSATVLAASATYAVAAAMRNTVSVGIEFTDTMARAEAVMMTGVHTMTEAGRSMAGMEMQVRALGASTMFTANEVAGALVELGMAGLSSTEAMISLAPTLDLAAIGGIEMGRAADIATNVMTSFNKTAEEMTGVVDLLAYAITNSNTNIEQLANSISYVGPAAEAAGFGLEETVAAIQTLANAGIKGSRAGTGLRRMMVNLQNPTAKGAAVIEDLNVNLTRVDGTTRHLTDILADFNTEMAGMSDAERMAAIVDLFGVRASQSAARLIGASEEVANFRREMELAGGSAQEMRETIEDTLGKDWAMLKAAFQDVQLDVFDAFEASLRSATATMTVFLAKQQEINAEMSMAAGFSTEDIASGEGVRELDILIAQMQRAIDVAWRLGAAFLAFKATKTTMTIFGSLAGVLGNQVIPRFAEVTARGQQYMATQTLLAKQTQFTSTATGLQAQATFLMARGFQVATGAGAALLGALSRLSMVISTWGGAIAGIASIGYMIYGAVSHGFKDTAEYVVDHKDRVQELEQEYAQLSETIKEIEHTRSRRALEQREGDIRTEIDAIADQIDVYERLSATATGEYAEIYAARLSNLNHQHAEQTRALEANLEAQGQIGKSHEQHTSALSELDDKARQVAETQDLLTEANRRVAMGSRAAEVEALEYQKTLEQLRAEMLAAQSQAEETAAEIVNLAEMSSVAVEKLRESLNEEFRLERLSDFETLQENISNLNDAYEEQAELQRRLNDGAEIGNEVARNEARILELVEAISRGRRDNNQALEEGQSARDAYLAHFMSEEEQIQATRDRMEALNKEIAVMNALMAMGIEVDGERWETLWTDLLSFQERYEQLTKEDQDKPQRTKRNQELEEAIRLHDRLRGSYDALGQAAEEFSKHQAQLNYLLDNGKITADEHARATAHLTGEYQRSIDPLSSIRAELYPVITAQEEYAERVGEIAEALAAGIIDQDEATDAIEHYGKALEKVVKESDPLVKRLDELTSSYDSNYQNTQKLSKDLAEINRLHREGAISGEQYARMWNHINEEMWNAAMEADPAAQEMARSWEEASNRIDQTFADAFTGAFDSFDSFADRLLDGFKRLLAELAYQATLKPIVVQFTQQMGASLGIPGMGAAPGMGAIPGGVNPGMLSSMGNTVSGWFGGGGAAAGGGLYANAMTGSAAAGGIYANAATGAAQGGLYGNALTGGVASPGMFESMGGMGGLLSTIGAGYAGMQVGNMIAPDAKYGNAAGALGAIGGAAFGPLGSAIGGAIAPAISKGLFGGSWQTKDGGLNLGVSGGDITGNQYEHQRKSGGLFRGSSYRTNTSALDGSFEAALSDAYNAQEASLALTLDVLGQQSSVLNSFSIGLTKISTKGKSEAEVEQAVQDWLQNVVNRAARSVVDPAEFALAGETTVETLNRLATALTGVNPLLDVMHDFMFEASLAGGDMADQLATMSGGMEQFTQRANYYWETVATETERHDAAMRQAAQGMGAFTARTGEIVTSTDQLRELVNGIDLTTESGRHLYAEAMKLAPALMEVEAGLERVRDRFADMLNEAESALSSAEQQARSAWQAFSNQAFGQQITLLESLGESQAALNLQRERELLGIDPLLHETQRFIWAMEDEAKVKQNATQAAQNYRRELDRVRSELSSTFNGISQWVDQQSATAGTPGMNLSEAGDQFARQLVLAQSGDRNALQSITQYAEQYLTAGEAMYASGGAFQRIQGDVLDALKDLPDQISAEEYLAEEIRAALQDVVITAMPTDERLATLLGHEMQRLDANQLTSAQVRAALSPIATDAEINKLLRRVDANGDGIITEQELANQRLSGLAGGIGSTLAPMFDSIDLDASGLIDWNEFYGAFAGLASDSELRRIFNKLDKDGSGTISRLEAISKSSDGTDDNTKTLEERARDQLTELNGLVSEMSRTTDQFVGLNSGITSLSKSINALGVAQAEVARIEKERAAAEKAERERLTKERQASALVNEASGIQSKIDEFRTLAEQTGQSANGNIDRYRGYNWIDGDQSGFLERIQDWTYSSQMAAWTARRLELADGREGQLERLRADYQSLMGTAAPFADGGIFELGRVAANSIVSTPTLFNMGLMGEADPEAIVPLSRGEGGRLGIDASGLMRLPDGPLELPMPNVPLPQFPQLGNADVLQALNDVKRELVETRKENARLLGLIGKNTGNAADAINNSAARAERQRAAQLDEQRAATSAARVKGRTI